MRLQLLSLFGLAIAGAAACVDSALSEPAPDLANPKHAEAVSVSFDYPGNWTLEHDEWNLEETRVNELTVESAGSAIVLVQVFRPALDIRPTEMMEIVRDNIGKAITQAAGSTIDVNVGREVDTIREFFGARQKGRLAKVTYAMLGVQIPYTLEAYVVKTDELAVVVAMQSADEDRKKAEPAFALIEKSLRLRTPVNTP